MRERLINRRRQGDLGEASAIEWLTGVGATVLIPIGHSPDYDLVAEVNSRLYRVQVKTSTRRSTRADGSARFHVQLATRGGNRSWSGVAKSFDPRRVEYLFVLVSDGRRWMIPARKIEGRKAAVLGGERYRRYEVSGGEAIDPVVYGRGASAARIASSARGSVEAGESSGPVKSVPMAEWVRIPPPPSAVPLHLDRPGFGDSVARSGHSVVGANRRTGIPRRVFEEAGLSIGDRLRLRADGPGRVIVERIDPAP